MMSIYRVILATVMNLQPKGFMFWIAWPCLLSTPWNLHLNLNSYNLCLIFALFRSFASLWTFYCGLGLLIFHTMIRHSFKIACASTICSVKTNKFSHPIYQNPNRSDKMVTSGENRLNCNNFVIVFVNAMAAMCIIGFISTALASPVFAGLFS